MRTSPVSTRLLVVLAALVLLASPGCYYGHLAQGQLKLLRARRPVEDVLADPTTPRPMRDHLEMLEPARDTARELGLEVGEQYTSYVDWPGDRIVTTIVATRPGEIEPAGFRFPIVGRLPYKGYFSQERAEREAERLRAQGLDVCVSAIRAYSTLGWMADPVTRPMLAGDRARLFETVVHELVHATVFLASQPDFNESVASFIAEQATVAYFEAHEPGEASRVRARRADDRRLAKALLALRDEVVALYSETADGPLRPADAARREALSAEARRSIAALAFTQRDGPATAERVRLNDACLALQSTYASDADRHRALLEALGGDLERFVARLVAAADRDAPEAWFFEPLMTGPTTAAATR